MEEPKTETNLDDAITFRLNNEPGEPAIKMSYDGKFFVQGREVTEDKELYNAFVAFFRASGHYKENPMTEKTLNNTNMNELKANVSDVQLHGDPGAWVCVCKASSKEQGWMKSTKAMNIEGLGVLVQVSTQQGNEVAEALTFVPGGKLHVDENGIYHFTLL
jgi:hypothetical protein